MKPINDFELINHGIDNSQYFRGCGISGTRFEDIATGYGNNPHEAVEDALESLAQNDWDTDQLLELILKDEQLDKFPEEPSVPLEFQFLNLSRQIQ